MGTACIWTYRDLQDLEDTAEAKATDTAEAKAMEEAKVEAMEEKEQSLGTPRCLTPR
jgi:hypothetical protein